MSKPQVGDVGTDLEVAFTKQDGAVLDISSQTTLEIKLKKPNGAAVTKTATFVTDGTNGLAKYTTIANDLDLDGRWSIQGYVVLPSGEWHTKKGTFDVEENIS